MPVRTFPRPASATLAAALLAAREAAGLTLTDVSRALLVSRNAVWAWEAGRFSPRAADLVGLAHLYGWDARRLGELLYQSYPAGCRRPKEV